MQSQDNILGVMPVRRLVLTMSSPIMLSMLMSAIYNLVDSIYVAQVSDLDFLALSYAYPVQLLVIAFCCGLGVGFNAILAKRLGQGKLDEAANVICHGFLLYGCIWLLALLFALFGCAPFFRVCTDNPAVARAGVGYLTICAGASLGLCIQFLTERILQSTGHPAGFMIVQGTGALLNLVLDPIFIFGLDLGVVGAAAATVTGQTVGACVGLFLVARIRRTFPLSPASFHPSRQLTLRILRIAAPAIVMQSLSSVMTLGLNQILNLLSETAVFVLGVYVKIQSFVFMPVFGVNNGLVPILSYNYGAKDAARISQSIRFGLQLSVGTGCLGATLLSLAASPLLRLCFHASREAVELGVPALRMTSLAFPAAAVSIVLSSAFQSLDRSSGSLLISLLRQVLLLLPIALALALFWPSLVWLSFLLSEVLTAGVAVLLYRRTVLPRIRTLNQ